MQFEIIGKEFLTVEIGPAHLINAGHRVLVGPGPPAKWPAPRAGTLSHLSPPGTESPCHPQTPTAPPFSRPLPPHVPAGHCPGFSCYPTCAVALIPSSIEAKFTCSSSLLLPIPLPPSPLPCAPRADGKLPCHQRH
jgi:hypothetical protein